MQQPPQWPYSWISNFFENGLNKKLNILNFTEEGLAMALLCSSTLGVAKWPW